MFLRSALCLLCVGLAVGQQRVPLDATARRVAQVDSHSAKAASAGGNFLCPEPFGDFHDDYQCDKYWTCEEDIGVPRLCADGLVFDFKKAGTEDPCDSPYVVDCGNRVELQPATAPDQYCPRSHGYYAHPDLTICNIFFTCIKGDPVETTCSHGLHFNEATGTCDWPSVAGRENCSAELRIPHKSGFTCPLGETINDIGVKVPHPSFPNLDDCQKFIVCLNGVTAQDASCNLGQVFSEKKMLCDFPEKVPECADWYLNDPRLDFVYEDLNAAGKPKRRNFDRNILNRQADAAV